MAGLARRGRPSHHTEATGDLVALVRENVGWRTLLIARWLDVDLYPMSWMQTWPPDI
jgi:hypothetical protein